jgi:S1-C subfamily serine protease
MRAFFLVFVAACASADRDATAPRIDVQPHCYEVPRIPHPLYLQDGVVITRLDGESAWTKAGLVVNDVIESVNGESTLDEAAFRKAAGDRPRKVRITSSRAGPVGRYRIVAIEVVA